MFHNLRQLRKLHKLENLQSRFICCKLIKVHYKCYSCILKEISRLCSTVAFKNEKVSNPPNKEPHIPVLCQEVCKVLKLKENGHYLDMTFGAGGHSRKILESHHTVKVYGLDRDPYVRQFAENLKADFPNRFHFLTGKFSDLPTLLYKMGLSSGYFDGVLMDLGPSSMQFSVPERGFMLSKNGPLDMRMDGKSDLDTPSASEILAHIDEVSLYRVLKYYGQEKRARAIARAIIEARLLFKSLNTTEELAELVSSVTGIVITKDKLNRFAHPATKTFQALRILVNDELNQLDCGIRVAHFFLKSEAILAAISFHSLEDTILKRHITGTELNETSDSIGTALWKYGKDPLCTLVGSDLTQHIAKPWRPLSKHVQTPSKEELEENPRARSAKLRVASKLDVPYSSLLSQDKVV